MPKSFKIALILVFILTIFAPEARILAQEGPSEGETSYLPSHQQWAETVAMIPVRILNFFKRAIPFTPTQWKSATKSTVMTLKDATNIQNVKNFFSDAGRVLGNIKDFLISFYHEFY
ncbi:MAG: hypothetical protein A2Y98_03940 [Candidatus Portnoybacteria bacterium RBG_19FT_COMBO_36_7]|uniref:Uncharacterized protein n=1 Tax=Candidatus Portnoybacteria bacterium RBG_19FT_COMBO_36_7 TaxID=1801992 RepID=A0A1G2FA03_9BACT|nr:MAG: hypothetical protein A2Y98_03940 [Candidatus Portnoybacteria bacterium RBG_19FT_COMBO_36_7]